MEAFAGITLTLAVKRLRLAELLEQVIASRFGPASQGGATWKRAGCCVILSHCRHENFWRT